MFYDGIITHTHLRRSTTQHVKTLTYTTTYYVINHQKHQKTVTYTTIYYVINHHNLPLTSVKSVLVLVLVT